MVFHNVHWYSMTSHAIPPCSTMFRGIPWHAMLFHDVPWYSIMFHCAPWYSTISRDIPWHPMLFHGTPRYSMTIPQSLMLFPDILRYSMTFHDIPQYSMIIILHDFQCYMIFHDIQCYFKAFRDISWCSMTSRAILWYSMILHGIPRRPARVFMMCINDWSAHERC